MAIIFFRVGFVQFDLLDAEYNYQKPRLIYFPVIGDQTSSFFALIADMFLHNPS